MSSPGQEALLALQDLDSAVDRLHHRRESLPERTRLKEAEDRLGAALSARSRAEERVTEVAARQQPLEAELSSSEARAADIGRRMAAGEAGTGRDMSAMATSLEHLRARISDLEDQVLAVMEERGPADADLVAAEAEVERLKAERDALAALVAGEEDAIAAEIAALHEQRPALAGRVPAELLATYDRLRPRLGGVAAARLVGSHCDGCHLVLPATELDRIRHLPDDAVVYCDQCGRILVRN